MLCLEKLNCCLSPLPGAVGAAAAADVGQLSLETGLRTLPTGPVLHLAQVPPRSSGATFSVELFPLLVVGAGEDPTGFWSSSDAYFTSSWGIILG